MKNRKLIHVAVILLAAVVLGFIDLPAEKQKAIFSRTPQAILQSAVNLGLDLLGGSQLDYKIDLRKVPQADQKGIIDGILGVINKRVNSLGVSEPNIYTSDVADEKHLIVELAGVKDLDQAKAIVGKTIQLEFKEQKQGGADPKEVDNVKAKAQSVADAAQKGSDLKVLGQQDQEANPDKIAFMEVTDFKFKDQVDTTIADALFKLNAGQSSGLVETQNPHGFHVLKVTDKQDAQRDNGTPKTVKVQHILIAYKGAQSAADTVTRSDDDAKKLAADIEAKLKAGAKFEDLAKQYSDDASNKDKGGVLDQAVIAGKSPYVKEFEDASVALNTVGQVSDPVKTVFGYHIIKAMEVTQATTSTKTEPEVKYLDVFYSAEPDQWQSTGLDGQHFVHADVEFNQAYQPYVSIQFDDAGSKLFEDLTARNIQKPLAIFVGGQLISAPTVNEKIAGGKAQISGNFTIDQANNLAENLNTGAIPAPITLVGQYTIGATLGQDALQKSINAGLIGFALVAIFMILYYRLPGFLAVVALSVYIALLMFLIKIALPLGWSLTISTGVFVYLITKILKSRETGSEKVISLILSCFILFFLSFLLSTSVVLTLAGIAGVVLSIGMAVDANILIFERVKEELRDGRTLGAAIEVGFDRAWNSIRDSNFSSLITCAILFYFGSSIIQGFAFNLAAGILVSMFTAITISKTLISALINTKLAEKLWLFGAPKNKAKVNFPIIQNRKIVYWISGIILVASMIGIPVFGLKLGLDFTGGTQMEIQFKQPVQMAAVKDGLTKSIDEVNKELAGPAATKAVVTQQTSVLSSDTSAAAPATKLDPSFSKIVPSDNNSYILKIEHISSDTHDLLIASLKKNLGDFTETKFSTVGPTVGSSLEYKAILAVLFASIMIIAYIAFAFRRVPSYVGKWRFGVTAILALVHDLGVMIGVYVYFGVIFGVEIDALFITALLTILGFSVHDTIVVFDRIREKLKYQRKDESFEDIANQAVNETLARSINTSFSVLLTMLALAFFGSDSIRFFVLSLVVGIISGTYSSIFVATPLLVDWHNHSKKKRN